MYAGLNTYNLFCTDPLGCPPLGYLQELQLFPKGNPVTKAFKDYIFDYLRWPTISLFGAWSWTDHKFHLCLKVGLVEINDHKAYDANQATSIVNLGWFAGFSDSTHFGTWGGSAGLQVVPYTEDGVAIKDIPASAKKTSLAMDFSEKGGYTSIDLKGCWMDNSGCKTSDETFYKLYKAPAKPWEDEAVKASLDKSGYTELIGKSVEDDYADVEKYTGYSGGGFQYGLDGEIYKSEISITPVYYETCIATSPVSNDYLNPATGPDTTTTTTTITETTTTTTTLFPTTSLTTTTVTTTPWYSFYLPPDDLSTYAGKTVAPGKDINDIIANAPAWHPDPGRATYVTPAR